MYKKTAKILLTAGLLALYTQTVNAGWVKTNSPFSIPEIQCCVIRDGAVFIGTGMEGIFKSTLNDTSGWTPVCQEQLHNTGVKVIAASSKYLFAGVSGSVLKSSDNGISWVQIDSGINANPFCCMAATDDHLYIGGSGCVWNYSVNDRVWNQVSLGLNVSWVNGIAILGGTVYAATSDSGVFRSFDKGATWKAVNTGLNDLSVSSLCLGSNRIIAGTSGSISILEDKSDVWTSASMGSNGPVLSLVEGKDGALYADCYQGLITSKDGGATWTEIPTGIPNTYFKCFSVSDSIVFGGTGAGGACISTNNGKTWTIKNKGLGKGNIVTLNECGGEILVGERNYGLWSTPDSGYSWWMLPGSTHSGQILSAIICSTSVITGTPDGGAFRSSYDTKIIWAAINSGLTDTTVQCFFRNSTTLFAGTGQKGVFISTNNGTTWTRAANTGLTKPDVRALLVNGSNLLAATAGGGIFISANSGSTWSASNTGLTCDTVYSLARAGTTIIAGTAKGIFFSTTNGSSWIPSTAGISTPAVWSLVADNGKVIAGTSAGVYFSQDNGPNWNSLSNGLKNPDVHSLLVSSGLLYAGTWGDGMWRIPLSEMVGVIDYNSRKRGLNNDGFSVLLDRSNKTITLEFSPLVSEHVVVKMYDLSGRKISSIIDKEIRSGRQQFTCNLKIFPRGCYMLHVQIGPERYVRKLHVFR